MTDTVEAISREELRRRFAQAANEADLNTIDAIVTVVQREVLPKVVQAACDDYARLLRAYQCPRGWWHLTSRPTWTPAPRWKKEGP